MKGQIGGPIRGGPTQGTHIASRRGVNDPLRYGTYRDGYPLKNVRTG